MVLYELNPPATQNIEDGMKMAMQTHGGCSRCKFECRDRWTHDHMNGKHVVENRQRGGLKWPSTSWDGPNGSRMQIMYRNVLFFEHKSGTQMRFWSPIKTKRHNLTSTVPPFFVGGKQFSLEICSIFRMGQKISKDVAWSGLRPHGMAQMGPECKLCKEMYYFLNTTMAHKGDFGAQ